MFAKLHGVRQISPLDTGSNLPQLQSLTVNACVHVLLLCVRVCPHVLMICLCACLCAPTCRDQCGRYDIRIQINAETTDLVV